MSPSSQTKNWFVYPEISPEVNAKLEVYPKYLRQILYNRGIVDDMDAAAYLNASDPGHDPFLLLDMDKTVQRLFQAIDRQEKIVIYGDYDVDGVSASALMVLVLQTFGAKVESFIPNRFDEGYGLNSKSILELANGDTKVILTVDCGIRSPIEAECAKGFGIDLIISDHHNPKNELPNAYAIICPKREGDPYPYKDLAGVGLAYKIAQAMFTARSVSGWSADDWLDLVALGTVADIVPLTGENRSLVRRGINQIRSGRRIGIRALAGVAGKEINQINAMDIGYILGPRLNAAGRVESATKAYSLLVSGSIIEAGFLAQELDNQNSERQKATKTAQELAKARFESLDPQNLIAAFFKVYDPAQDQALETEEGYLRGEEIYPGIVGLVASKLTEHYYRPSIAGFVDKDYIRASCRSISEFHITKALDECSDLLVRHGGHAMAAGFTVKLENKEELLRRLLEIANHELADKDLRQTLKADLELDVHEILPLIYPTLEKLQPTGMANPSALFVTRNVKLSEMRLMGKEGTHIQFKIDNCEIVKAIAFNQAAWFEVWKEKHPRFDLAFSIEINRYFGSETQQINVRDMKLSE